MKILACNSNRPLAEAISAYLHLPLTDASVRRFQDQEVFVEVHENARGEDVFIIQSTSFPANDNLMELLVTLDALKRASVRRATAVMPYYGYARQDRKSGPRTPISAKLVANMITAAGADRVLTLDLHAGQIQGFFDIPLDNLFAAPVFIEDIKAALQRRAIWSSCRPMSAAWCARARSRAASTPISPSSTSAASAPAVSEVMNIIGDVEGRRCILIDDIVDSAGTLCNAAEALIEQRREIGRRLCHAWRALGRRRGARHRLADRGARYDRQHRRDRQRARGAQHPAAHDRAADGGGDPAHQRGALGLEPVRLG